MIRRHQYSFSKKAADHSENFALNCMGVILFYANKIDKINSRQIKVKEVVLLMLQNECDVKVR